MRGRTIHLREENLTSIRHQAGDFCHVTLSDIPRHFDSMSARLQDATDSNAHKLIAPRWIGMKRAFAMRSPSGLNSAHKKSKHSLILVLMANFADPLRQSLHEHSGSYGLFLAGHSNTYCLIFLIY
jgi:hypothetical protein